MADFVALDFETADQGRDSACSLALVVVKDGRIAETIHRYIRPPRPRFQFTYIHGITWEDVKDQPDFAAVWSEIGPVVANAPFLAAHNAAFDRGVLETCCRTAGLPVPAAPYLCTVQVARQMWALNPAKLPDVCHHLGIALKHHDAISDAQACAQIVLAAVSQGFQLSRRIKV